MHGDLPWRQIQLAGLSVIGAAVFKACLLVLQDLQRATSLFNEMVRCGVERNVHTYTALMNVCIKCQNCAKALETYNTMRQSGCFPNVVTYNTLIECAQCLL